MALAPSIQVTIHTQDLALVKAAHKALTLGKEPELTPEAFTLIDEKRQLEAQKRQMEQARPGRGDTGKQVFGKQGLPNAVATDLVTDLVARGYRPIDKFFQRRPLTDRETGEVIPDEYKYVVRVSFSREASEMPIENWDAFVQRLIAFLEGKTFPGCHVWENDNTDTINLTGKVDPNCRKVRKLRMDDLGAYTVDQVQLPK